MIDLHIVLKTKASDIPHKVVQTCQVYAADTVGQKTAPMFVHFGKTGMVWSNDKA